ncbi:di-trans,poly-cis-decaprenylcistransferase [archaeon]|jgi:tritrans,polycis-undecaprenyl-diphosphate synthase [geranylgeranyl-diphosphate specific]|nr:di-trans,poly-cis-decaprenylcistransferase [archaeon]NHV06675.1 di-trans,poly-cis-decaprenylcistransferase [Nitrososphaerota archaeon]
MGNSLKTVVYDSFFRLIGKLARLNLVTKLYEEELKSQIKNGPLPQHIALILDGNRRWSSKQGVDLRTGYLMGAEKLQDVLNWIYDLKIRIVTIYALSTENLKRSKEEIELLLSLFYEKLLEISSSKEFNKYNVRVKFIGRKDLLPSNLVELMEKLEQDTQKNNEFVLNIAIGYGGRQEIVDAIKKIVVSFSENKIKLDDINEQLVEKYLYTSHLSYPDPDLIIRTSGEFRVSNFLIWQSAYSEFFITDVLWPDFRKIDLYRAIRSFQGRVRRYGL